MEHPAETLGQDMVSGLGEVPYFCRVLRILINNRVDLSVSSSDENGRLHEGLDVRVGPLGTKINPAYQDVQSVRGPT